MHAVRLVFMGRGLTRGRLQGQMPRTSFPLSALRSVRISARQCLCIYEAVRRPKHYAGLQVGMSLDFQVRRCTYAMRFCLVGLLW